MILTIRFKFYVWLNLTKFQQRPKPCHRFLIPYDEFLIMLIFCHPRSELKHHRFIGNLPPVDDGIKKFIVSFAVVCRAMHIETDKYVVLLFKAVFPSEIFDNRKEAAEKSSQLVCNSRRMCSKLFLLRFIRRCFQFPDQMKKKTDAQHRPQMNAFNFPVVYREVAFNLKDKVLDVDPVFHFPTFKSEFPLA